MMKLFVISADKFMFSYTIAR